MCRAGVEERLIKAVEKEKKKKRDRPIWTAESQELAKNK
jgi:hypothetical protein